MGVISSIWHCTSDHILGSVYEKSPFILCLIQPFNLDHSKNILRTSAVAENIKLLIFFPGFLQPKMLKIQMLPTHLQSTRPPYSHSFLS